MPRSFRRLALSTFAVLALSCHLNQQTQIKTPPPITPPEMNSDLLGSRAALVARCATGVGWNNPNGPVICVRSDNFDTDPIRARVYDQQATASATPSGNAVWILWLTDTGEGDLGINFSDTSCTEKPICSGAGECRARVKMGSTARRCRYTLNLSGKSSDPEVEVNPCCN